MSPPLLEVEDLRVEFVTRKGIVPAVRGVSFSIERGSALGLVGESGCGKSVTSLALMGLVELPGRVAGGSVRWKGQDLLDPKAKALRRSICGREIAIVFQDPMTSLDPLFTVGAQIAEVLTRHRGLSERAAQAHAVELLDLVRIRDPHRSAEQYPHQFSGGMRQRALIAMSLACEPELLIADEPTTALDVTVQAGILDLVAELQEKLSLAVLLITHDLGVVARLCDRVAVMYGGQIVESGPASLMLTAPTHPYARGLLEATPRLDDARGRLKTIDWRPDGALPKAQEGEAAVLAAVSPRKRYPEPHAEPLVKVDRLSVAFPLRSRSLFAPPPVFRAVDDISFQIFEGETLGLVGESGSGKTTTGRALIGASPISGGTVSFAGRDVTALKRREWRSLRRDVQIIFQDPYSSLNPKMTVEEIVSEPLIVHGIERDPKALREKVAELLSLVGMPEDAASRYPYAFSGGQRQRVGIARALALEPRFIIADEPVSALDVSIRAQVVNLMQDLQDRLGLTYLFIAHDLAVVRHIADRVAIMQAGKIVEMGPSDEVYANPQHPYTQALLAAVPQIEPAAAA
ncbi:MAG: ABC transporter ATP-binding protein [Pseudomonadota bacterium]